jgi:DNA-binding GntR family transcriptional regulator
MLRGGSATLVEAVHGEIREEIFRGNYLPGQRLGMVALANRFSVSQSVIREALTRLTEQKLVVALPQQGFRVVSLSRRDLDELTEARIEVECLVLRLAIERGDVAWESSVLAAHHRLARIVRPADPAQIDEWLALHDAYHLALLRGCGNERLADVAMGLRDAATLYRRWSQPVGHDYHRDFAGEHRVILDAILARDAAAATGALRAHISRTSDVLIAIAQNDALGDTQSVAG